MVSYSAEGIDRVRQKFCKWTLNVKQSTNNLEVCSELGICRLIFERKVRRVKFWLKLITNKCDDIILNTVCRILFVDMSNGAVNWLHKVKHCWILLALVNFE